MSFIHNTEAYYNFSQTDVDSQHKGKIENGVVYMSKNIIDHDWFYERDLFVDLMSHFQEKLLVRRLLAELGGVEGIGYALRTNKLKGLPSDELDGDGTFEHSSQIRIQHYGANKLTKQEPASFFELCLNELEDFMLRILIVCSIISIGIGLAFEFEEGGWIDGIAILVAVCIVVFVGAANNYSKEQQFRIMEKESEKKFTIVLRNGVEKEILFEDVLIGDLVVLRAGYNIPCDGVFVFGTKNFTTDESGLTGETKEIKKNIKNPLLMAGTSVRSGDGLMIAVAIGDYSQWGQLMAGLQEKRHETPLQARLDKLGVQIGYGGMVVGALLFVILLIAWFIREPFTGSGFAEELIHAAIAGVIIVVVAVPEGLPLAVTISLAYSMKTMLVDNNFVRHLSACETMGNATTICSDKTGTLTQNKMSVDKAYFCDNVWYDAAAVRQNKSTKEANNLNYRIEELIMYSQMINSKAFYDEHDLDNNNTQAKKLVGGNQTECALLQWAIDIGTTKGINYKEIREKNPKARYFPFDSNLKRSSVLLKDRLSNGDDEQGKNNNNYVMYTKGAAEQILDLCNFKILNDQHTSVVPLDDAGKSKITSAMNKMTRMGLRCIGLCYKPYTTDESNEIEKNLKSESSNNKDNGNNQNNSAAKPASESKTQDKGDSKKVATKKAAVEDDPQDKMLFENMVWLGLVGIKDPVRPEVPLAVRTCQNAGIIVRMVTGDHLETAKHIAKECNILSCAEHICMTGSQFRNLTEAEKDAKLPLLRVLARSKPQDKEDLVRWYMAHGDVVAVTGDGANDALALKEANIGLSMGIQGTDVAKEASDIVIMDDNFKSIEKTVMWGRSVYDNIRKFMQFQLTVNVSALTLSLIAAFWEDFQQPLNPVQLLWVNLIMDTMAALALATERPTVKLLERLPFEKNGSIISPVMLRFIFGHSVLQLVFLLFTLFAGQDLLGIKDTDDNIDEITGQNRELLTVVFNLFVWFQIFNEINARRVNNERNVFEGFFANHYFTVIMIITAVAQFLIILVGGDFTRTMPISLKAWGYCIGIGATSLVWHQLLLFIPVNVNYGLKEIDVETVFKRDDAFMNGNASGSDNSSDLEDVNVVSG